MLANFCLYFYENLYDFDSPKVAILQICLERVDNKAHFVEEGSSNNSLFHSCP
jgi:hypothetical protein